MRLAAGQKAGESKAALEKRLLEETEREGLRAEQEAAKGGLRMNNAEKMKTQ